MSTTHPGTTPMGRTEPRREADDGRRGFVAGSTEARPGILTTEFWLSIAMAAAVIIAAYAVSRGLAKAGSREGPIIISTTERDNGR